MDLLIYEFRRESVVPRIKIYINIIINPCIKISKKEIASVYRTVISQQYVFFQELKYSTIFYPNHVNHRQEIFDSTITLRTMY